jgi:hypothetical protein
MAKEAYSINLLPNKGDNLITQFFNWALTVGRLLVILTETLALSVFIYRFTLDMRIVDLNDQIRSESIIVSNFQTAEENFRNLQTRLAFAKKYDETDDKTLRVLQDITNMGRNKVTFKQLLVTTKGIDLEIQAPSPGNLSQFITALKTYPGLSELSIDQVANKTSDAEITVSISANMEGASQEEEPSPTPIQSGQSNQ